jgi:hypothetical protein
MKHELSNDKPIGTSGVVLYQCRGLFSVERADMMTNKKGANDGKQRSNGR